MHVHSHACVIPSMCAHFSPCGLFNNAYSLEVTGRCRIHSHPNLCLLPLLHVQTHAPAHGQVHVCMHLCWQAHTPLHAHRSLDHGNLFFAELYCSANCVRAPQHLHLLVCLYSSLGYANALYPQFGTCLGLNLSTLSPAFDLWGALIA